MVKSMGIESYTLGRITYMSMLPSFLQSSRLKIKVDGVNMAYATALSFSDRMSIAPVGGIGSANPDALEPLQYSAQGSMTITVYTDACWDTINTINKASVPGRASTHTQRGDRQGNSLLNRWSFSPAHIWMSSDFDIDVYERGTNETEILVYQMLNCRLTNYSMSFTPGTILQENINFLSLSVVDLRSETVKPTT
jgi:hypothetical protein